jgi:hypothetical protein
MELGTQGHGVDHDGLLLRVIVEDAVLAGAVGDLHHDKVALSGPRVKVTLSTGVSIGVLHRAVVAISLRRVSS